MFFTFMRRRGVVALDFDGTLLPTYEQIALWHDAIFDTDLSPFEPAHWSEPRLVRLWGGDATAKEQQFYKSGYAYHANPIEGSREAVAILRKLVKFVVITSGSPAEQHNKKQWLKRYFPTIKRVGFTTEGESKVAFCHKFGASVIIEDRYDYAAQCARSGINAIIIDRYRWGNGPVAPRIHHASSWAEIPELIRTLMTIPESRASRQSPTRRRRRRV